MFYDVRLRRSVRKRLDKLPAKVQLRLIALASVLRESGSFGPRRWPNYGKIRGGGNRYHCHLTGDHAWVACWEEHRTTLTIEVYYAGSHQNAPY